MCLILQYRHVTVELTSKSKAALCFLQSQTNFTVSFKSCAQMFIEDTFMYTCSVFMWLQYRVAQLAYTIQYERFCSDTSVSTFMLYIVHLLFNAQLIYCIVYIVLTYTILIVGCELQKCVSGQGTVCV